MPLIPGVGGTITGPLLARADGADKVGDLPPVASAGPMRRKTHSPADGAPRRGCPDALRHPASGSAKPILMIL